MPVISWRLCSEVRAWKPGTWQAWTRSKVEVKVKPAHQWRAPFRAQAQCENISTAMSDCQKKRVALSSFFGKHAGKTFATDSGDESESGLPAKESTSQNCVICIAHVYFSVSVLISVLPLPKPVEHRVQIHSVENACRHRQGRCSPLFRRCPLGIAHRNTKQYRTRANTFVWCAQRRIPKSELVDELVTLAPAGWGWTNARSNCKIEVTLGSAMSP